VVEELDFGDPVIDFSMGFDRLIVSTARTCYVYSTSNFGTPHSFELKAPTSLILQAERYALCCVCSAGLAIATMGDAVMDTCIHCNALLCHYPRRHFLLVDNINGPQVFSYEGKLVSAPRLRSLPARFLKQGNIALSNEVMVVIDRVKPTRT